MMVLDWIAAIGRYLREGIAGVGFATRFFFNLLAVSPGAFRRPGLISEQTHFIGNYSLVIIIVSGLFVGMVLGLQGYITLTPYGAEQKLGQVVALALVRELGPVVTALLFAGRAGTSLTAQIGLMKAGEQLSAMEMMAINPIQRVLVADAGQCRCPGRRHEWCREKLCIWHCRHFHRPVPGLPCATDAGRCVARHHPYRGDRVADGLGSGLRDDRHYV